jgi:hypothetical protein
VKIRFQMKNPAGNLLFQGLRLSLRQWPCVLWAYGVNLGFGLLAGIPYSAGIAQSLDNSLASRQIFGNLNTTYLGTLILHLRELHGLRRQGIAILWLSLVEFAVLLFLIAGTVHVYFTGERPKISTLTLCGKEYFWRFVRISLLAAVVAVPLLTGLLELRSVVLRRVLENALSHFAIFSTVSAVVVLLAASPLRLWLDLIEVYTVRNGMLGNRRVRAALRPTLQLLGNHLLPMLSAFLLAGILGTGFLTACLYLWKDLVLGNQLWLAYLVSQLGLFLLLATRFWQRGMEVALILAVEPSTTADVALREIQRKTARSPAEPTIQELLQKLRTEPWAKAETILAGTHELFPPAPPPPPRLPASIRPPQDSLLAEHRKKVRLLDPMAEETSENSVAPPPRLPSRETGAD